MCSDVVGLYITHNCCSFFIFFRISKFASAFAAQKLARVSTSLCISKQKICCTGFYDVIIALTLNLVTSSKRYFEKQTSKFFYSLWTNKVDGHHCQIVGNKEQNYSQKLLGPSCQPMTKMLQLYIKINILMVLQIIAKLNNKTDNFTSKSSKTENQRDNLEINTTESSEGIR